MKKPIIAILTDFGLKDGYVAAMKGVILERVSEVYFIDISHNVEPFRIDSASYVLASVFDFFPAGTVFLCVVDPGVGTLRKAVVVHTEGKYLVGPDNGLFSLVVESRKFNAFYVENYSLFRHNISSTFHGRDIFAPAVAYLSSGGVPADFGPPCDIQVGEWAKVVVGESEICGRVIHIDRFGNIVTNITFRNVENLSKGPISRVHIKDYIISGLVKTYGDVSQGALCALWGSSGHLEISVNHGNAADVLKVRYGDEIILEFSKK